ncbi:MAG: PsbP-related protein [Cyanobacteria bacterium P01_H01_bin.153]
MIHHLRLKPLLCAATGCIAASGLVSGAISGLIPGAIAQSQPSSVSSTISKNNAQSESIASDITDARPEFERYSRGDFSIEYPTGWLVDPSLGYSGEGVTLWNREPPSIGGSVFPPDLTRTNIEIEDRTFSTVIENFERYEDIFQREPVTIGGMNALRIWIAHPDAAAIYTIIEYSDDQTAVVGSFYADDSWVETIYAIHESFRKPD